MISMILVCFMLVFAFMGADFQFDQHNFQVRWFNKRGLKDSSTPCSGINGERLKSISDLFLHGQHVHSHIHQRIRLKPPVIIH